MDRKFIWGCLGIVIAAALVLFVAFYIMVLRPTQEVMPDLEQIAALGELNDQIRETREFIPPANSEFTVEQLERFARVQDRMRDGLGDDYALLRERAELLHGLQFDKGGTRAKALTIQKAILLFKNLGPVLTVAKESQIEGINQEQFSLVEYRWVRENLYRALEFSRVDVYLEDFEGFTAADSNLDFLETETESVESSPNLERAAPYGDSAKEWFPYLVFGL